MSQFHETGYGKKFLEHDLPELTKQIKRVADGLENKTKELTTIELLKERYRTLSSLNSDPKSKHHLHIAIEKEMVRIMNELNITIK